MSDQIVYPSGSHPVKPGPPSRATPPTVDALPVAETFVFEKPSASPGS